MLKNGIKEIEAVFAATNVGRGLFEQLLFYQCGQGRLQARHFKACSGFEVPDLKALTKP